MANQNQNNKGQDQALKQAEQEIVELKEALESLKEQNVQLEDDKKSLQQEIVELKADVEDKAAEIDVLNGKMEKIHGITDHGEPIVEIVAVPKDKNIKPPAKHVNGEKVKEIIDEDGYHHYFLPKSNAAQILGATSGMKHYLVGPMDFLKTTVPDGLYTKEVTICRYRKVIKPDRSKVWRQAVKPPKKDEE